MTSSLLPFRFPACPQQLASCQQPRASAFSLPFSGALGPLAVVRDQVQETRVRVSCGGREAAWGMEADWEMAVAGDDFSHRVCANRVFVSLSSKTVTALNNSRVWRTFC